MWLKDVVKQALGGRKCAEEEEEAQKISTPHPHGCAMRRKQVQSEATPSTRRLFWLKSDTFTDVPSNTGA